MGEASGSPHALLFVLISVSPWGAGSFLKSSLCFLGKRLSFLQKTESEQQMSLENAQKRTHNVLTGCTAAYYVCVCIYIYNLPLLRGVI